VTGNEVVLQKALLRGSGQRLHCWHQMVQSGTGHADGQRHRHVTEKKMWHKQQDVPSLSPCFIWTIRTVTSKCACTATVGTTEDSEIDTDNGQHITMHDCHLLSVPSTTSTSINSLNTEDTERTCNTSRATNDQTTHAPNSTCHNAHLAVISLFCRSN